MTSYESYAHGLRLLEGDTPTACTLPDVRAARASLDSLHSATIGAGSNTWRVARARYDKALARFKVICALAHKK